MLKKRIYAGTQKPHREAKLATETIEGASLPLQSVDHVHGGHGLPLGVLGVGDGVPDHVLQEDLQHAPGLLVDQPRDPLDTPSPSETPDGWLGDALDVVTKHLPVTLSSSLPKALATLATSGHLDLT